MDGARAQPTSIRAERTRALILEAAEKVFAEKGFAAARLEDVAERVGIRRASIVYYYRDKRELYEAVLDNLFGGLLLRLHAAFAGSRTIEERIDGAIGAWVDYVANRPALARILLREIADASPTARPKVVEHAKPILDAMDAMIRDGQARDIFEPIDPIHLATTVGGATVFFISATPLLGEDWPFDPLSADQLAAHRREVLRIVRRLLGVKSPRLAKRPGAAPRDKTAERAPQKQADKREKGEA